MRLTEALDIILKRASVGEPDEPQRIVEGHLRHLHKKEEGTTDGRKTVEGQIHSYVEYHHTNLYDIGVAYNEDRVWVCLDGVSLFRAKAVGGKLLSEYHPRDKQYRWGAGLKGTSHKERIAVCKRDQEEFDQMKKELEELRNEALSGD
jgi:hypothetical protein